MITVELTEEHLELLRDGAEKYGRCSLIIDEDIIVAVTGSARRSRPSRAAQRAAAAIGARRAPEESDPK